MSPTAEQSRPGKARTGVVAMLAEKLCISDSDLTVW